MLYCMGAVKKIPTRSQLFTLAINLLEDYSLRILRSIVRQRLAKKYHQKYQEHTYPYVVGMHMYWGEAPMANSRHNAGGS